MKDNSYDYLVKLLIIGDSGVGKTALLNRFVFNTFRQVIVFTKIIDLATHPIIII